MKKIVEILCVMILPLTIISCKKEYPVEPAGICEPVYANIIGAYKIIGARYTENSTTPQVDYYEQFFDNRACAKDNILTFGSDGIFTLSDEAILCTPAADQSKPWRLSDNHKIIIQGEKPASIAGIYCHNGIIYLEYADWNRAGDILLLVLQKQN